MSVIAIHPHGAGKQIGFAILTGFVLCYNTYS